MGRLARRGEILAREQQRQRVQSIGRKLRSIFGSAAVEVEEARILVRGRGMIKRWLIDPNLRFLIGGLK